MALQSEYGWLDEFHGAHDEGRPEQSGAAAAGLTLQDAKELALRCGLDLNRVRIDRGRHSMTLTTGADDIRILLGTGTVDGVLRQLYHELGHARLEMLLKESPRWSWRAQAPSQAFHEGVARFFESAGPLHLPSWVGPAPADAMAEASAGHRSAIRLESTGPWYSWHIWLRFKLERLLIEGDLDPSDLPDAWQREMRKHFDRDELPPTASCLQDVQWSMGLFGYFPLYWEASKRGQALFSKLQAAVSEAFSRQSLNSTIDRMLRREAELEGAGLT